MRITVHFLPETMQEEKKRAKIFKLFKEKKPNNLHYIL